MSIKFDIIQQSPGQYYTSMKISNMKESDGNKIVVSKYLYVSFLSPVIISDKDIMVGKWDQPYIVHIDSCKKIFENHYDVELRISTKDITSFTINEADNIVIQLNSPSGNPDLNNIKEYMDNVSIEHDHLPHIGGTVKIVAAASTQADLQKVKLPLRFSINNDTSYQFNITPGTTTQLDVFAEDYKVSCESVHNADRTLYSEIVCKPDDIKVNKDKISEVHLSYGEIHQYSVLNFSIADIKELSYQSLSVSLNVKDSYNNNFNIKVNESVKFYELPTKGELNIKIKPITLNNTVYSFKIDPITLTGAVEKIQITDKNIIISKIDDKDFLPFSISVTTTQEFANSFQLFELLGESNNYSMLVEIKNNKKIDFPVKVAPGEYKIICSNFIEDKKVYIIDSEKTINVSKDTNSTSLNIKDGAKLDIRGFDSMNFTFGGCATLEPSNIDYFSVAKPASIFKYAGVGGDGDPTTILSKDQSTERTIDLSRAIEAKFVKSDSKHNVLPVMISYTAQLSGGDIGVLQKEEWLKNSFANYILTLKLLNNKKDGEHLVPGGVIVNPDMLGSLLQKSLSPTYSMPVKQPLKEALKARAHILNKVPDVPNGITEDLKGYIFAVNWLTHTIAPDVTFGWQINIWGINGGGSQWIYDQIPNTKNAAKVIANFLNLFEVYNGAYKPDFLAIDRYEADDLTVRAYANSYCYGPKEWAAYFDFCADLSSELKLAVMPWQIPASRTPLVSDSVNENFDSQHWGTAATYILGEPRLGNDVQQIHPTIRNFSFKDKAPNMAKLVGNTPGDMYQRNKNFDVSFPAYTDFPLRGIFHVELGGGSTVGMVPPVQGNDVDLTWANDKLKAYAANPVTFNNTLIKH